MSTRIALEILLVFLLVVANGAFAMAEIAIVSSRKARLRARSEEGDRSAAVALELAENPDRFLSTVQIGITLVGILAGVFGGATIAEELGAYFKPSRGSRRTERSSAWRWSSWPSLTSRWSSESSSPSASL